MKRLLTSLLVVHALACSLMAQTKTVLKVPATNALTESLVVPSGKTLTIASGATINATGATITGFTASAAWADITGKPSTFPPEAHNQAWSTITSTPTTLAGYGIADAITAATAASTYLAKAGGTMTGFLSLNLPSDNNFQINEGSGDTRFQFDPNTAQISLFNAAGGRLNIQSSNLPATETNHSWPSSTTAQTFALTSQSDGSITAADVTGLAASATTNTTNASNITTGTIDIARIADAAITNAKLAGSIALSKLAITGTPDGTKFIRDDGSYQAINLSGYLPLTGGSLTGALVVNLGDGDSLKVQRSASDRFRISTTATAGNFWVGDASYFSHETSAGAWIMKYANSERARITFAENVYNVQIRSNTTGDYGLLVANSSYNGAYLAGDIRLNNTVGIFKIEPTPRQAIGGYTGAGHTLSLRGGQAQTTSTGAAGGAVIIVGGAAGGSGNNNGGDVTITAGAPTGSGTRGRIFLDYDALPTSDPVVKGQLWRSGTALQISAGP